MDQLLFLKHFEPSSAEEVPINIEWQTPRLQIRSYLATDFKNCIELYGDQKITKFFDDGKARSEKQTRLHMNERGRRYFDQGQPFGVFSVFLRSDGSFIGQVDLVPTGVPGEVEIGWIFHERFQGQGFCSEAVLEFLMPLTKKLADRGYLVDGESLKRVIATAHPENKASNRMIEKAGLTFFKEGLRYSGNPRLWYALEYS